MISLVPSEEVYRIWPDVAPLLQMAIDVTPSRYDLEGLFEELDAGRTQLWIGFDEDYKVHSAGITRIYETQLAKIISIEWLGGERLDEWEEEAIKITESYGKQNGCSIHEVRGRDGWGRRLAKYGWTKVNSTFERLI